MWPPLNSRRPDVRVLPLPQIFGGSGLKIPIKEIFISGTTQMLAMAASNEALRYVSYPTQVRRRLFSFRRRASQQLSPTGRSTDAARRYFRGRIVPAIRLCGASPCSLPPAGRPGFFVLGLAVVPLACRRVTLTHVPRVPGARQVVQDGPCHALRHSSRGQGKGLFNGRLHPGIHRMLWASCSIATLALSRS